MKHINGFNASGAVLLVCLALGCSRDATVSSVPKETGERRLAAAPSPAAQTGQPEAEQTVLQWKLPPGWFERPGDAMRAGSFAVTNAAGLTAEISVIPLAGTGGTELGNVNRWRGQVGLPPVSEQELPGQWQTVELGTEKARLTDLAGQAAAPGAASHIIAATYARGATTWFFKMTGSDPLVAEQKPAFLAFLKSVRFETGGAQGAAEVPTLPKGHPALPGATPMSGGDLPAGHPPLGSNPPASAAPLPAGHPPLTPVAAATPPPPQPAPGTLPPGWTQQAPKPMQSTRYVVSDGGREAEISLTELGGTAGGPLANVNRWRGQIGLGETTADDLAKTATTLEVAGAKATLVNLVNEAQKKRLIAVIVPRGEMTRFYKIVGEAALVQQQQDAFVKFVQAAK